MKSNGFFLLIFLFVLSGFAAPIYEPFNYVEGVNLFGQVNTNDGNISWVQAGATTVNQPIIAAENLNFPGRPPGAGSSLVFGGSSSEARLSFPDNYTIRTVPLYYSYLLKVTDLTGIGTNSAANTNYLTGFNNSQGSQTTPVGSASAVVLIRGVVEDGVTNKFQLGIARNNSQTAFAVFPTNTYNAGQTLLIVASYNYLDGETASLWVNPDPSSFSSLTPPPPDATAPFSGTALNNIRSFILYNRSGQPQRMIMDDLLIGPTWADVAPKINDMQLAIAPVHQRLVPGMDALFEVKALRTENYRWQFNGTDIPNAASTKVIVTNAQVSNAGTYSVIMSNAAAMVTNSVTLSVVSTTSPTLLPLWSAAPGSQPYMTTGDHQRTIAYYAPSNHLYVVSRTNGSSGLTIAGSGLTINVLNASNGQFLYQLMTTNTDGSDIISSGTSTLVLSGIGVAEDGAVYACNVSTTAGSGQAAWKLYRWANGASNTVPTLVFAPANLAFQTTALRWGDVMAVRGSGINTQILVDDNEGVFATILTPTDESMAQFQYFSANLQYFNQSYGRGSLGRSLQFGASNSIWQMRRGRPYGRPTALVQTAYELFPGSAGTGAVITNLNFTSVTGPVAVDITQGYLAAIIFAQDSTTSDSVVLYDILDFSQPILLARKNFPVNRQSNGSSLGQVLISSNRVFALDANNGLMAFEIGVGVIPPPSLSITRSGNDVLLSWQSPDAGFVLEKTASLTNPVWSPVTETVQEQNGQYAVTIQLSGTSSFYRLTKP